MLRRLKSLHNPEAWHRKTSVLDEHQPPVQRELSEFSRTGETSFLHVHAMHSFALYLIRRLKSADLEVFLTTANLTEFLNYKDEAPRRRLP